MNKPFIVAMAALAYAGPQGARVAVTLQALHMGMAPAVVGILNALSFALPMVISIPAGRIVDRTGLRRPILLCGAMMVCTLVLAIYGKVYVGEWFVGTLGFVLQAMAFLALDMLATCFTKNQVSAAIVAFAANFLLWMLDLLADQVSAPLASKALSFISLYDRYEPFILGQLSLASVVYFVSFIALCLTATVRGMDARRFAQGGAA